LVNKGTDETKGLFIALSYLASPLEVQPVIVKVSNDLKREILDEIAHLRSMGLDNIKIIINERGLEPVFGSDYADFHRALDHWNHRMICKLFGCEVYLYLGAPRTFGVGRTSKD